MIVSTKRSSFRFRLCIFFASPSCLALRMMTRPTATRPTTPTTTGIHSSALNLKSVGGLSRQRKNDFRARRAREYRAGTQRPAVRRSDRHGRSWPAPAFAPHAAWHRILHARYRPPSSIACRQHFSFDRPPSSVASSTRGGTHVKRFMQRHASPEAAARHRVPPTRLPGLGGRTARDPGHAGLASPVRDGLPMWKHRPWFAPRTCPPARCSGRFLATRTSGFASGSPRTGGSVTSRLQFATASLIAFSPLAYVWVSSAGCSPSASTCSDAVSVSVGSVAVNGAVTSEAGAGSGMMTLFGTVTGATCGVQGVSVLSAVPATATLPQYASWSALVPLALLQSATPCSLANDAGDGVFVTVQAIVPAEDGGPDVTIDGGTCVALGPVAPGICSTSLLTCPGTNSPSMPANVQCQLPEIPGLPATLGFSTDVTALGDSVSWRSAGGLVAISAPSPVIANSSHAEFAACASQCGPTGSECVGSVSALVVGASGAAAGVDAVIATIVGYPAPATTVTVAVQGPAKITQSSAGLANNTSTFATIQNPMLFSEACTVALPEGTQVALTSNEATLSGTQACPLTDASTEPCVFAFSFSSSLETFNFSFIPNLTDAVAIAAGLGNPRLLTIACSDQFDQSSASFHPRLLDCRAVSHRCRRLNAERGWRQLDSGADSYGRQRGKRSCLRPMAETMMPLLWNSLNVPRSGSIDGGDVRPGPHTWSNPIPPRTSLGSGSVPRLRTVSLSSERSSTFTSFTSYRERLYLLDT